MPTADAIITGLSSTGLRVGTYIFLRWIPGHQAPPLIFSLFAIYCMSFISTWLSTTPYKVIAEEIDIVTHPIEKEEAVAIGVPYATEELDIADTVILAKKPPRILTTLLTGLPSPSSLFWSIATFLLNLALVSMAADFTFRSALFYQAHDLSFARLGYVSESSARILVREPDAKQLPIFLSYRYADIPSTAPHGSAIPRPYDGAWKHADTVQWLTERTDFTAAMSVEGLKADTRYQYALSNNHSGYLITAPPVGKVSERRDAGGVFTFLHSSCLLPHFPYRPLDHPLKVKGFEQLSKWLGVLRPSFMLFLGDFIYIDNPRRHGSDVSTYRREYRQVYASPDWPSVASTKLNSSSSSDVDYDIPWLHTYDDHEIANDWSANTTGVYPAAFDPYMYYHLSVNPPLYLSSSVTPANLVEDKSLPTWSTFTQGPATFFILDTRRYRTPSTNASDPAHSMLGPAQLHSLLYWLSTPPPPGIRWKILISSVPFTKNWQGPSSEDTWAGYLYERHTILSAMWSASTIQKLGIVILSGDRHEFAATAFPPPSGLGWTETVHEFSVSPLSMFYLPVRTYVVDDGEDICLKYIPNGNSKFGAVSIGREMGSGVSVMTYRLFVDGEEAWSHVLTSRGELNGLRMAGGRESEVTKGSANRWLNQPRWRKGWGLDQ